MENLKRALVHGESYLDRQPIIRRAELHVGRAVEVKVRYRTLTVDAVKYGIIDHVWVYSVEGQCE